MNDLIVIKQLPVIEERLKQISAEIDLKITEVMSLECNEETVKTIKNMRAELNKDFKELDESRKDVKRKISEPYEQFEAVFKLNVSDKFKAADKELSEKITSVEDALKKKKEDEIREYFNEYLISKNIDFITYESANINITLSARAKSLKEQAKAFIDRIADDLTLIETQEFKAEIMVEYKKSLNASLAITTVSNRHKEIEQEQAKVAEVEAVKVEEEKTVEKVEAISAPVVEELPLIVIFKVTATKDKLKALKQFLNDGGYKYE